MRTKVLLLSFVVGSVLAATAVSKNAGGAIKPAAPASEAAAAAVLPAAPQDPPGTIDGAKNPELIPDHTAYALLFNFFASRDESERGKLAAYCRQNLLGEENLNGLLTAARFYQQQVAALDAQAQAIRDAEPLSSAAPKLASLQARRDAVVAKVMEKLPQFVGPRGAAALRSHMERVKAHIKIIPGPVMPGDMPGMNH
jgi:hypothetical protein